jgi:putative transposase
METAKDRYRVNRREPGCDVTIPIINGSPILDSDFEGRTKNPKLERIANLRFALVQALNKELKKKDTPRVHIIRSFAELYKSGFVLPGIYKELGPSSWRTLYRWKRAYDDGGVSALLPQYEGPQASKIAPAEEEFLLKKLLDQRNPVISDSIRKCKYLLGEVSPSSPAKLRRWVKQFRKEFYDAWIREREGEKALIDKCLPYAEREWRPLSVGEAIVGDGCKLNFQVINPFTGKPTRAMMVMFWDWKSSYPLGWEIMLTENTQCVVSALRNAIITLGKFPKRAYMDNGKAFRASIFTKKVQFEETDFPGIFEKLGIEPRYALPYNPQSKPIERFFRTFNDWFEREMPSYIGASIQDKPAYMNRNEKRARSLHNDWVPTIPETMELIFRWREYYIDQELRSRDNLRPRDMFETGKGPGVDPFALHFLMMTCKARMVHRNGITFNGCHWYHENLYGFKDYVLVYYSYYDLSQVYIFTLQGDFLCAAKPVEKVNPFAADSEFPEDMAAVQRINATKRKLIKATERVVDMIHSQKNLYIDLDRSLRNNPEVEAAIKKIEDKKPKVEPISPFVDGAIYGEEPKTEKPKYKPPKDWTGFKGDHWEMYEYLKQQDPKTLTPNQIDFLAYFPTTSEYQATQNFKPNRLLSGGLE